MRKIQEMTDAAIEAIDNLKPYGRLDDKHRLLIPAWAAAPAHSITQSRRVDLARVLQSAFGSENTPVMVGSLIDFNVPLENGSRLCTLPISEVNADMQFRFHIAFGEPGWMRGKEVLSTLKNMHKVVKDIMLGFDKKGLI